MKINLETGQNIKGKCIGNALYGVYYMPGRERKILKNKKNLKKYLHLLGGYYIIHFVARQH